MSEWISISKGGKNTGRPVLLAIYCDEIECVVGYWNRLMRRWLVNGGPVEGLEPTHWMPLPEPPVDQSQA